MAMRIFLTALCLVAGSGVSAATGEIATHKPAVLFVTHWGRAQGTNEAYVKRLIDAGMNVSTTGFDKVTPKLLAKFDVVVIPALPPVSPDATGASFATISPAANEKLLAVLDGYLNAGGGLLLAGPLWGWEIGLESYEGLQRLSQEVECRDRSRTGSG